MSPTPCISWLKVATAPGTLIPELEGRAEAVAGTFNAQGVANTLWAYTTMGREPGAGLMRALERRAEALAGTGETLAVTSAVARGRQPSP
jgi:hypothetical protein